MESRKELAAEKKRNGYNCAQAVACTYCDLFGIEETEMAAMTQALGTGVGGTMEGTCGAITGACVLLGMANKEEGRPKAMRDARTLMNRFMERNKTATCKVLKGIETGVVLRECEDCVRDAAEFVEQILSEKE